MDVKPSERPPVIRYVIRNAEKFYYDGHGQAPTMVGGQYFEGIGESGVPNFNTKREEFAVHYGDKESIYEMVKTHKKWCIDRNRDDLFTMFDTCDIVETYT